MYNTSTVLMNFVTCGNHQFLRIDIFSIVYLFMFVVVCMFVCIGFCFCFCFGVGVVVKLTHAVYLPGYFSSF